MRSACPAHLMFLDFISLQIFDEEITRKILKKKVWILNLKKQHEPGHEILTNHLQKLIMIVLQLKKKRN